MTTHDTAGRQYARMSELKAGDTVEVDGDFTCLSEGEQCVVHEDEEGLYILCTGDGDYPDKDRDCPHHLDGQLDHDDPDGDSLIGVYKVSTAY